MESQKNEETLDGGFLESNLGQNEILCSKIRENEKLGGLSTVSEKCVVDPCSDRKEFSCAEFERKHGDGNVGDVITGNYIMNEVSMHGTDVHNNDFHGFEGEMKFSGNDGDHNGNVEESVEKFDDYLDCNEFFHDEKIEEPMEKGNDVLHPHEPSSPTKIEVSGNNINLFVDVFGPLDGISGSEDNSDHPVDCKLGEINCEQESSLQENGTLSIGEQECTFDIGDLVWIKTRTQLWWPGIVSDPSTTPKDMAKCEKKGSYLAKYYGSANFAWCGNAELKPFLEYYEQMSVQKSSRNFFGSVEKALYEIGQRINLKMTCPCYLKESQTRDAQWCIRSEEENLVLMKKASEFDVLSLNQFQPATFIAEIRDLARSMHVRKVDLMVMKNRLTPFYRAIGHCELPLQLLVSAISEVKPQNGCENSEEAINGSFTRSRKKRKNHSDDKTTSSAKGFESRERKKSKYLSYPYVDVKKAEEKEDVKQSSGIEGSCSGVDSRKRGTKKPLKGHYIIGKEDDISASSIELLAELRSSARDCSYISKYSDSLKRFFCSFRMFAFLDVDMDQLALNLEKKPRKNKASVGKSVENVVGDKTGVDGNKKVKEKAVGRRGRKKKELLELPKEQLEGIGLVKESENHLASGSLENANKEREKVVPDLDSVQNSLFIDTNTSPKSSLMISFQQACPGLFKSNQTPQQSGASTPGVADTNSILRLPDLNGNHPCFSVDHIPVGVPSIDPVNPLSEPKKEGLVSPTINGVHPVGLPSKDVPATNGVTIPYQSLNGMNPITKNIGVSSFVQHSLLMGSFLSDDKPKPKKRKRKEEKACEIAPNIPDLNNNVMDMISPPGMPIPEGIQIPAEGEPQKKRRCRLAISEPSGSLLLNFSTGCVPLKETLVATFSRFGLLKESELEVVSDSCVKIVYERSSDARFAFRSLEKSHAFGESLISFSLDSCSIADPPKRKKKKNLQLHSFTPLTACKNRTEAAGESPDMAFIKQNVAMMKSMLEKAGDSLSPETRARLENEIKAFIDKISSVTGSSS